MADFRTKLLETLRRASPLFEEGGVMVVGSEVPNLLEVDAAATLVVSEDVDIAVPTSVHARVKARLGALRGFRPSPEEPSVWLPMDPGLLEINFVGMDPAVEDLEETYVLDDPELPLMVFGPLSLLRPGTPVVLGETRVPVPRLAGLLLEKLLTERTGIKGARDLLVALGLLVVAEPGALAELEPDYLRLSPEQRHAVRVNLITLSALEPHEGMPEPVPNRRRVASLLTRLEQLEAEAAR